MENSMDAMVQRRGAAGSAEVNHAVVIIGGGASGITVAAELKRRDPDLDIAIVEPSELHWYQPGWTLGGAGVFRRKQTERREEKLIPKGVTWIRAAAAGFHPEENVVWLSDGRQVRYDFLVACPGLKIDWDAIEGLTETLGRNGVCSNYRPDIAESTCPLIKSFRGGTALFTQPAMPIKCAGAAEDHVSYGRPPAAQSQPFVRLARIQPGGRRPVRRAVLRSAAAEGGRRLWHQGCLQTQSQGDRRSREDCAVFRDGRGRQGRRSREA